jgi:uncharacterized membrane protein (DUF2068 family)
MSPPVEKSQRVLALIAAFKLVKAAALVTLGTAIVIRGPGVGASVRTMVEALKIDPGNHHLNALLERVSGVSAHTLHEIAFGTFLYAAIFATEGVGLLLRKRWAEYMTLIVTASFLPFEIYELVQKLTAVRVGALAANVAIVVYLAWKVRRDRASQRSHTASSPT